MKRTATPRKPVLRLAHLHENILGLQIGKASFAYLIEPIPADFGIGIRLRKQEREHDGGPFVETEVYDVNLDLTGRKEHICSCLGFMHHGHCKHVEALQALQKAGELQKGLAAAQAAEERRKAQERAREWEAARRHVPALAARLLAIVPCR